MVSPTYKYKKSKDLDEDEEKKDEAEAQKVLRRKHNREMDMIKMYANMALNNV